MQRDDRDLDLRALGPDHLDGAVALSRARRAGRIARRTGSWSLGLSRGIAALDGDRVVGTVLVTPFGTDCATINMVIVDPRLARPRPRPRD